jgi:small subunit ribosomal protein S15
MTLGKDTKTKIIDKFKLHDGDTGSSEVQIAILTERITGLVEHLKKNRNDQHSRRGLLMLVGQRKRLLNYLQRTNVKKFEELTTSLGLKT